MRDLEGWLDFHSGKAAGEYVQALNELNDVRRQLDADPTVEVETALELDAPTHPVTGDPLREFDYRVLDVDGAVINIVEVTTVKNVVKTFGDFTNGIRHAIDKAFAREELNMPIDRPREVSVYGSLPVGVKRAGAIEIETLADGTVVKRRITGEFINRENIMDQVMGNLPKIKNSHLLDVVTLVDVDRGVLAQFERTSQGWRRRSV